MRCPSARPVLKDMAHSSSARLPPVGGCPVVADAPGTSDGSMAALYAPRPLILILSPVRGGEGMSWSGKNGGVPPCGRGWVPTTMVKSEPEVGDVLQAILARRARLSFLLHRVAPIRRGGSRRSAV